MKALTQSGDVRADRVAAWATGVGGGFLAFMVSWLAWSRVLEAVFSGPVGPVAAMIIAVLSGVAAAILQGRRLARRFR